MYGFQSGPLHLMEFLIPAFTLALWAAKGHTVGPWDKVSFWNLIHFAVCGFCGATAGPCVRPVWRSRSITPRELHALMVSGLFSSLLCGDTNTSQYLRNVWTSVFAIRLSYRNMIHLITLEQCHEFSLMRLLHFYWRCQKGNNSTFSLLLRLWWCCDGVLFIEKACQIFFPSYIFKSLSI